MPSLLSQSRIMILANRIGLLTPDELIAWADGMILGTSEPPCYLIDLALGDLPTDPEALDLVRNEPNESEIAQLAQLILERFNDTSEMNALGLHCYQLALLAKGQSRERLLWMSDEIHLCVEGIKSLSDSEPLLMEALLETARPTI
ncbi:hypothetical protein VUJ49_17775 [Pseudomonas berkeleyensis]|uniref:Uncharacterized protein n=1 Tax=Pseudomonas berkeleyensis TaxID=2726956 RepID=A0A7G5DJD6_9PSED|nr:hypothetical protein [Pseudomonas berkeleyensis]QMV61861.1 hypothetical protein HS968_17695 [Pseudomonas berkeleyensis]WSO37295.1 hypothetical protein VUJ49_17775 [Pseudomonas berkeleyensis]